MNKTAVLMIALALAPLSFSQTTAEMKGLEQIGALNLLTQERTKRLREDLERFKELR